MQRNAPKPQPKGRRAVARRGGRFSTSLRVPLSNVTQRREDAETQAATPNRKDDNDGLAHHFVRCFSRIDAPAASLRLIRMLDTEIVAKGNDSQRYW